MPLSPYAREEYPGGFAANSANLSQCKGCDNILTTTTLQADGTLGACCGVGMRFIPELHIGNIRQTDLAEAVRMAEIDPLKQRIRAGGTGTHSCLGRGARSGDSLGKHVCAPLPGVPAFASRSEGSKGPGGSWGGCGIRTF
jgi:hypothetical protein